MYVKHVAQTHTLAHYTIVYTHTNIKQPPMDCSVVVHRGGVLVDVDVVVVAVVVRLYDGHCSHRGEAGVLCALCVN